MTQVPQSSEAFRKSTQQFKKGAWYCIEVPSVSSEILDVEEAIMEALSHTSFAGADVFAVRLALDEALANAMKHGNAGDESKLVTVRFCIEDDLVTISVKDQGPGFDYSNIPDCTDPDRLELPCGRGLLIMKAYMDSIVYNECGNEVTMTKGRGNNKCAQ